MNYLKIQNELIQIFHRQIILRFNQLMKILFKRFQLIICCFALRFLIRPQLQRYQ